MLQWDFYVPKDPYTVYITQVSVIYHFLQNKFFFPHFIHFISLFFKFRKINNGSINLSIESSMQEHSEKIDNT